MAVSVADAHLGATLQATPGPHAVLTSDPADLRRIYQYVGIDTRILTV